MMSPASSHDTKRPPNILLILTEQLLPDAVNIATAPGSQALIEWFRIRREEILDATPAAQFTQVRWPA